MQNTILVSGSIAFDTIMTYPGIFSDHIKPDKAHVLSVAFTVDSVTVRDGGTGANIAYSLALLGEKPTLLGSAGEDAATYRDRLEKLGVDVSLWQESSERTAAAHIMTDMKDNQITAFHGGAMFSHEGGIPEDRLDAFEHVVLAPDSTSRMEKHAKQLIAAKKDFIFDPGQSLPGQTKEALEMFVDGASMTIVNDYESSLLAEALEITEEELAKRAGTLIVTLGDKGSKAHTPEGMIEVGVAHVNEAKDPTGAGDAFRSGLLKGLAQGETLERCMQMGAVVSAYAVEHAGTQEHSFTRETFEARLAEAFPLSVSV